MLAKRETEICNAVGDIFSAWKKFTIGYTSAQAFNNDLKRVALACSRYVIFNAVPGGEMTLIAPRKICRKLRVITGGGEIMRCGRLWYWQGRGAAGHAVAAIKAYDADCASDTFLRFIVPPADLEYITRKVITDKLILADLQAASDDGKMNGYCGPWTIARRFKAQFGGKLSPCGNYWVWSGQTDPAEFDKFAAEVTQQIQA